MSVHLLRVIGPDMVVYHPAINTEEQRSEIGLACEEVILRDGPDFLLGLLQSKTASVRYEAYLLREKERLLTC